MGIFMEKNKMALNESSGAAGGYLVPEERWPPEQEKQPEEEEAGGQEFNPEDVVYIRYGTNHPYRGEYGEVYSVPPHEGGIKIRTHYNRRRSSWDEWGDETTAEPHELMHFGRNVREGKQMTTRTRGKAVGSPDEIKGPAPSTPPSPRGGTPSQGGKGDSTPVKQSARVLRDLHDHLGTGVDYIRDILPMMDHPKIAQELQKLGVDKLPGIMQHLRNLLSEHHGIGAPGGEAKKGYTRKYSKALEVDPEKGGHEAHPGEEGSVEEGEIPPGDLGISGRQPEIPPGEQDGVVQGGEDQGAAGAGNLDPQQMAELEAIERAAIEELERGRDTPEGQGSAAPPGSSDLDTNQGEGGHGDAQPFAGEETPEEEALEGHQPPGGGAGGGAGEAPGSEDDDEILERYQNPKTLQWFILKHRIRWGKDGRPYLIRQKGPGVPMRQTPPRGAPARGRPKDLEDRQDAHLQDPGEAALRQGEGAGVNLPDPGEAALRQGMGAGAHLEDEGNPDELKEVEHLQNPGEALLRQGMGAGENLEDPGEAALRQGMGAGVNLQDEGNPEELKDVIPGWPSGGLMNPRERRPSPANLAEEVKDMEEGDGEMDKCATCKGAGCRICKGTGRRALPRRRPVKGRIAPEVLARIQALGRKIMQVTGGRA
jgi:hypothetical protein